MIAIKGLKPIKFRLNYDFAKSARNGFCDGELCVCVRDRGEDHTFRLCRQVGEKDSSYRYAIDNFAPIDFLIVGDRAFMPPERAKLLHIRHPSVTRPIGGRYVSTDRS